MRWLQIALTVIAFMLVAPVARAQIVVDVTKGHLNPTPIAVPDFSGADATSQQVGRDVADLIRNNLQRSALFRPLDQRSFIERNLDIAAQPRFADWKAISAQALVVGEVKSNPDGGITVVFRLWDVVNEEYLAGKQLATTQENWRRTAHKISDEIYQKLTGEGGYFDTRILFVAESGPKTRRVKRLAIMDQDGHAPSFLTDGENLVLTPRFSPTEQKITYMSYQDSVARVYLFNLDSRRREALGDFPGLTFAPRFTPDGRGLLFSLAQGGNSDIYSMDLRTRQRQRLTDHPSIDTSPSASPDGSQIVFTSDRGGSPQLYVMNADGGNQRRITFGRGLYSTPVWSPRGDLIAFTRQFGGRFMIGVIRPDGSGERLLTEAYLDEGPTWAPNGRVIAYFRETRPGQGPSLWSIDLTGVNERRLTTPGDASDPAWSPLLP